MCLLLKDFVVICWFSLTPRVTLDVNCGCILFWCCIVVVGCLQSSRDMIATFFVKHWKALLNCPVSFWIFMRKHKKMQFVLSLKSVRGPSLLGLTRSISWLLMPWLFASPGHQQPSYWLCRIGRSLSYSRRNFNYLCLINVEEWHKM